MMNNNNLPKATLFALAVLVFISLFFTAVTVKKIDTKKASPQEVKQEMKLTHRDKENVMIHKIINGVQTDEKAKLDTVYDLALRIQGITSGQYKLGNICSISGIYPEDNVVHVGIACKKILP